MKNSTKIIIFGIVLLLGGAAFFFISAMAQDRGVGGMLIGFGLATTFIGLPKNDE